MLWAATGHAQTPAAAPLPRKMGVIDFDRAVLNNNEGIKARTQLEVRVKYWQEQLDPLLAKLKAINDKAAEATNETEKANLRKQAAELEQVQIKRILEDRNKDIEERRGVLFKGIAERVKNVLKQYGDEQGYAVIANNTSTTPGPILIHSEVADVTSEIVRRVNADIEKNPAKVASAGDVKP
jgi:Skp family chaperone for outer membrane proteins